jgi:hypothetical protein
MPATLPPLLASMPCRPAIVVTYLRYHIHLSHAPVPHRRARLEQGTTVTTWRPAFVQRCSTARRDKEFDASIISPKLACCEIRHNMPWPYACRLQCPTRSHKDIVCHKDFVHASCQIPSFFWKEACMLIVPTVISCGLMSRIVVYFAPVLKPP